MSKCPECGKNHRTQRTSLVCFSRLENACTLDIIAYEAGNEKSFDDPKVVERRLRLDRMEEFYKELKNGRV